MTDVAMPTPRPEEVWVVGAVIRDPLGRIFMQRRTASRSLFADSWDLVGGHLEPGESILETLAREILEETGWTLSRIVANLGEMHYVGDDGVARREVDFLVEVDGDLDRPSIEAGLHEQPLWASHDEALRLLRRGHPGEALVREIVDRGFAAMERSGTAAE
jgi:8-oxo-dGTP pyrophosphatase MutT (NUDIX family)